jgi:ribosomal protein L11 methyltransferase
MMWEPVAVGRRFFLLPDWRDDPPPAGRVPIKINPGLACGTGWHEATQLCLEALERHVRPGTAVLDVGAGAGILSVAAALLGAGCVAACDIDAEAVAVARRRLAAHSAGVHLFLGSAEAIRAESCDVVVANINAATVIELAGEFWRSLRPGGVLLVCGFEGWEFPAVNRAVAHLRPESLARMDKDEWTLIEAQKTESHR